MRRNAVFCVLLATVTFFLYWPVHDFQFVDFDDPEFIENNEQIRSGLNWETIHYAFTTSVVGNWHPITTLSHALDCQLFGFNPGAHHLVNAVIHAVNSGLLLFVLTQIVQVRMTGANPRCGGAKLDFENRTLTWMSLFVAALFALHPLRVESVAWVSERKDVLSGFFFFMTLVAYTKYSKNRSFNPEKKRQAIGLYMLSLVAFALGLMSKPMLVTVPFLLLLLDYWPFCRMQGSSKGDTRRLLIEKIPFLLLSGVSSWITVMTQEYGMASTASVGLTVRVCNALLGYVVYLRKFFWPSDLAPCYPHRLVHGIATSDLLAILASGLLLMLLTGFAVWRVRSSPYFFVGWFWFVGMMIPVIGLVQVGTQAMADRYTYLPMVGIAIAVTWGMAELVERTRACQYEKHKWTFGWRFLGALGVAGLGACMVTTRSQLEHWRGTIPLFEHTLRVTKDNIHAEFALAIGLHRAGKLDASVDRFRSVLVKNPRYSEAHYGLGLVLAKQNQWVEALSHFREAVVQEPNHLEARLNLAKALVVIGRDAEAVIEYEKAIQLNPNSAELLNNYAWLLATSDLADVTNGSRAVELAERACQLTKWRQVTMIGTLAAAYARVGRFDEAVATGARAKVAAEKAGDHGLAARNEQLMILYRSRQAFTESRSN